MSDEIAIFLLPCSDHCRTLDRVVFGANGGEPRTLFDPHVTLYHGVCGGSREVVSAKICEVAKRLPPISMKVVALQSGDSFWKATYLALSVVQPLPEIASSLREFSDPTSAYAFSPHLSVRYGEKSELDVALRSEIPDLITFDRISLVSLRHKALGWEELTNWRTELALPLEGR